MITKAEALSKIEEISQQMTNKEKVSEVQRYWADVAERKAIPVELDERDVRNLWTDLHRLIAIFEKCELVGEFSTEVRGTVNLGK